MALPTDAAIAAPATSNAKLNIRQRIAKRIQKQLDMMYAVALLLMK